MPTINGPYFGLLAGTFGGLFPRVPASPMNENADVDAGVVPEAGCFTTIQVDDSLFGRTPTLNANAAARLQAPIPAERPVPESGVVRRWLLPDLFPESAQKLGLADVDAYLSADGPTRRALTPPTYSRLRKIQERLESRSFEGSEATRVRSAYLEKIQRFLSEPTSEEIFEAARRLVPFSTRATESFWSLSLLAQMGVYEVAAALSDGSKENVGKVLTSRAIDTFRDFSIQDVFETAALLADRRVQGFERAFQPRRYRGGRVVDDKFLSAPEQGQHHKRLPAEFAEYQESLRMSGHGAVVEVDHDAHLAVDWRQLTPQEEDYLRKNIERHIPFDFRKQHAADVDAVFRLQDGRRRMMEVKSSRGCLDIHEHYVHKEMLQIFRHALLARIHGLEGVEYVFRAPFVSNRLIRRFQDVLIVTGVNYVMTRYRTADAHAEILDHRGMKPLGGEKVLPKERIHPFVLI